MQINPGAKAAVLQEKPGRVSSPWGHGAPHGRPGPQGLGLGRAHGSAHFSERNQETRCRRFGRGDGGGGLGLTSLLFRAVSDTARRMPSSTWASREKWKSLDICYLLLPLLLSGTAALASGTSSTVGNLEKLNAV